jgi:hypothetical protein
MGDRRVDVIGSREIAAGVEPAHRNGKAATSKVWLMTCRSCSVSAAHLGSQPRASTSMTITRAPQRGAWAGQHTWAIRRNIRLLLRFGGRRDDIEERADRRDALGAVGGGKSP